jgi:hypothetical protein
MQGCRLPQEDGVLSITGRWRGRGRGLGCKKKEASIWRGGVDHGLHLLP